MCRAEFVCLWRTTRQASATDTSPPPPPDENPPPPDENDLTLTSSFGKRSVKAKTKSGSKAKFIVFAGVFLQPTSVPPSPVILCVYSVSAINLSAALGAPLLLRLLCMSRR